MLASCMLPDHCAVLGCECHAAALDADGSMASRRLVGSGLCHGEAYSGDQRRRGQGKCFHSESFDVRMRIYTNPEADRAFVCTNPASGVLFLPSLAGRQAFIGFGSENKVGETDALFQIGEVAMRFYNRERRSEYVADIKKDLSPARLSIRSGLLRRPDALLKSINEDCGLLAQLGVITGAVRTDFSLKEQECEVFRFQFIRDKSR